jgi:hypothetical protein
VTRSRISVPFSKIEIGIVVGILLEATEQDCILPRGLLILLILLSSSDSSPEGRKRKEREREIEKEIEREREKKRERERDREAVAALLLSPTPFSSGFPDVGTSLMDLKPKTYRLMMTLHIYVYISLQHITRRRINRHLDFF